MIWCSRKVRPARRFSAASCSPNSLKNSSSFSRKTWHSVHFVAWPMWRRIGLSIASSNAVSEIEGGPVEHFVRLRGCMAFAPLRYAVLLQVGVSNIVSPTNTTQRCIAYRESRAIVVNFDRISARKGSPGPIDVEISQETLAEMIETTRSRVNFFMNKFCKNQAAFNRFSKQVARFDSISIYIPLECHDLSDCAGPHPRRI